MTTRADPPLPLPRLRARGELLELRAADLRFTPAEAGLFLHQVTGLDLAPDQVATLDARTEGWAAGPAARRPLPARPRRHRGLRRHLRRQPPVRPRLPGGGGSRPPAGGRSPFLLETSVLGRMTGPLCDAVTGRSDGQEMLESLERGGLFLVPLDDQRRLVPLPPPVRRRAARPAPVPSTPTGSPDLHRAASEWCAAHGDLADAIGHALPGGDLEYAADLVELALPQARKHRQNHALREWLRALPDDVLRRRAAARDPHGWARLSEGNVDGVEAWLDAAEAALETPAPPSTVPATQRLAEAVRDREVELRSLPAMVAVYRASVSQARGDVDGTVTHARRALELAGPEDHYPRAAGAGLRRPGGLGLGRSGHRGRHVHRGGRQPACGRHGRRRAGRDRRAGEHVAVAGSARRGAPAVRTRAGRGRAPPRPRAPHRGRPARRPGRRTPRAGRARCGSRASPEGARAGRGRLAAGEPAPLAHRHGRAARRAR